MVYELKHSRGVTYKEICAKTRIEYGHLHKMIIRTRKITNKTLLKAEIPLLRLMERYSRLRYAPKLEENQYEPQFTKEQREKAYLQSSEEAQKRKDKLSGEYWEREEAKEQEEKRRRRTEFFLKYLKK